MKYSAVIGGIMLVAGTAIGAGMLALPVTTGIVGFYPSFVIFLLAALFMLYNLLLLLEANLWLPAGSDIISMVNSILGVWGSAIAWIAYLVLLYSVVAAYIAGGSPFIQDMLQAWVGVSLPNWLGVLIFVFVLGTFVYIGTGAVVQINRVLIMALFAIFLTLIFWAAPEVDVKYLSDGEYKYVWIAIPIILFSFTSHLVVPSLRDYLQSNVKQLVIVMIVGSTIPFVFYVTWQFLVLGIIPFANLKDIAVADAPLLLMTNIMIHDLGLTAVGMLTTFFSFFALITSFLGVSLSLSHFLADGFRLSHRGLVILATFIPPLFFVLFYPEGFIIAISFAGVSIIVLFGILTVLMVWKGRYIDQRISAFRTPGGKVGLTIALAIGIFLLGLEISNSFMNWLPALKG